MPGQLDLDEPHKPVELTNTQTSDVWPLGALWLPGKGSVAAAIGPEGNE